MKLNSNIIIKSDYCKKQSDPFYCLKAKVLKKGSTALQLLLVILIFLKQN